MNRQKYRIVTNGLRYRVQVRSFFGWRDANEILYEAPIAYKDFDSLKDAKRAMREQIDADALDARKWAEVK